MNQPSDQSTTQIEREVEQTRAEVERDSEELRRKLNPGELFNDMGRQLGGREFLENLRRQATENPLAVVLVGIGLAWLILGRGRARHRAENERESLASPEYDEDSYSRRRANEVAPAGEGLGGSVAPGAV